MPENQVGYLRTAISLYFPQIQCPSLILNCIAEHPWQSFLPFLQFLPCSSFCADFLYFLRCKSERQINPFPINFLLVMVFHQNTREHKTLMVVEAIHKLQLTPPWKRCRMTPLRLPMGTVSELKGSPFHLISMEDRVG